MGASGDGEITKLSSSPIPNRRDNNDLQEASVRKKSIFMDKNRFKIKPPKLSLRSMTTEVLRSRTTSSMWDTEG